jgi:hypothetical protein
MIKGRETGPNNLKLSRIHFSTPHSALGVFDLATWYTLSHSSPSRSSQGASQLTKLEGKDLQEERVSLDLSGKIDKHARNTLNPALLAPGAQAA